MNLENKSPLLTVIDSFLASKDEVLSLYGNLQRFSVDFDTQHLITWFQQLRRGIVYVYDRFGTIANDIKIAETVGYRGVNGNDSIQYIPDAKLDCIAITEGFLARSCSLLACRVPSTNPHISPLWVNPRDFPILLGVEEAHHSYFIKSGQGTPSSIPGDYSGDPVELAAGVVVREALDYFRIKPVPAPHLVIN